MRLRESWGGRRGNSEGSKIIFPPSLTLDSDQSPRETKHKGKCHPLMGSPLTVETVKATGISLAWGGPLAATEGFSVILEDRA